MIVSSVWFIFRRLALLLLISAVLPEFLAAQNIDSLYTLAERQQGAGNREESRRILTELLQLRPNHLEARLLLSRLLAWEGRYDESIRQYDTLLTLNPANLDARFGKAQVLAWSQKYEQAKEIVSSLLKEQPASRDYRALLARILLWKGEYPKAAEAYAALSREDGNDLEALRGAARATMQMKNFGEAQGWYSRVTEMVPNDPEARAALQRIAYQSVLEVQLGGVQEWFRGTSKEVHRIYYAESYLEIDESLKPYIHVGHVSKFSSSSFRFGGGVYYEVSRGSQLFGQVLLAPGAKVVPRTDVIAELDQALITPFEAVASYRYLGFSDVNVNVFSAGVTWYISGNFWMTPRIYLSSSSDKSRSESYLATLHYQVTPSARLRLALFNGSETFRATTLNEIRSTRSSGFSVGLRTRVSRLIALNGEYLYTNRTGGPLSHQGALSISFLF